MRKAPAEKPPEVIPHLDQRRMGSQTTQLVTQVLRYELITPLFGGGAVPGTADPVTTVRASEIRGHLRFWWRACRGGRFGNNLAAMKREEETLWGAAGTTKQPCPSQVLVDVALNRQGKKLPPFTVVPGKPDKSGKPRPRPQAQESVAPAYAAFPLQPTESEIKAGGIGMKTKCVVEGVRLTLTITFPKSSEADVSAALWAWETFGGLGGRTRRGFGAIRNLETKAPAASQILGTIQSDLKRHVINGTWPIAVPHLSHNSRVKVTKACSDARTAWASLIGCLKNFRQRRNPRTSPGQPGRSVWPEPDEIRRIMKTSNPKHAVALSTTAKFPRAAFGLPIVFHFKRDDVGDPDDTMLQGKFSDRLASPLILRPLACANGKAVGVALILDGTGVRMIPGGSILKDALSNPSVDPTLTATEAKAVPPLEGNPDVLEAFLTTI